MLEFVFIYKLKSNCMIDVMTTFWKVTFKSFFCGSFIYILV